MVLSRLRAMRCPVLSCCYIMPGTGLPSCSIVLPVCYTMDCTDLARCGMRYAVLRSRLLLCDARH
eukprot:1240655-Rhodomonas_salina.1